MSIYVSGDLDSSLPPKTWDIPSEMALMIAEKAPRAYLDDQTTVKLVFFPLTRVFFVWCIS